MKELLRLDQGICDKLAQTVSQNSPWESHWSLRFFSTPWLAVFDFVWNISQQYPSKKRVCFDKNPSPVISVAQDFFRKLGYKITFIENEADFEALPEKEDTLCVILVQDHPCFDAIFKRDQIFKSLTDQKVFSLGVCHFSHRRFPVSTEFLPVDRPYSCHLHVWDSGATSIVYGMRSRFNTVIEPLQNWNGVEFHSVFPSSQSRLTAKEWEQVEAKLKNYGFLQKAPQPVLSERSYLRLVGKFEGIAAEAFTSALIETDDMTAGLVENLSYCKHGQSQKAAEFGLVEKEMSEIVVFQEAFFLLPDWALLVERTVTKLRALSTIQF